MFTFTQRFEFHIGTKKVKFVEDHPMYTHMDSLALIIFVVSEKKAFEHFPKRFFSETTWTIESKLPRNDHWKVLYKVSVFLCRSKIQDGHHMQFLFLIGRFLKNLHL
jgi:hypothetical protein